MSSRQLQRLRSALEVRGESALPADVDQGRPEAQRILKHLDLARKAADAGRVNEAWAHLDEVEQIRVGLVDADELKAIAVDLRHEAVDTDKFRKWRGNAILDHVGRDRSHKVTVSDIRHALRIRAEHFGNVYTKIDETASLILGANVALVALLTLVLGLSWYDVLPLGHDAVGFMGTVVLMGAVGGALSTGLSLVRPDTEQSVPQLQRQGTVTFFRPVLGGAMAAVIYVFIQAGLLDFLGSELSSNVWLMASFGFVGGFSERWFMGIVSRLAEDDTQTADPPKEP